jgi:hypothetical protein
MNYVPPAYIERVGDPQFPRFVFRDSGGNYFTPRGTWSENPDEAALFYTKADAVAAQSRYLDGEHVRDSFTLKIVVTTDRDAWSREQLVEHLARFAEIVLHRNREQRSVVVEVHWDDLRKTE